MMLIMFESGYETTKDRMSYFEDILSTAEEKPYCVIFVASTMVIEASYPFSVSVTLMDSIFSSEYNNSICCWERS